MYSPFYTINDLVKLINMLDVKAHKYQNRRKNCSKIFIHNVLGNGVPVSTQVIHYNNHNDNK